MHDCIGQIIRRSRKLVVSKESGMEWNQGKWLSGTRKTPSTSSIPPISSLAGRWAPRVCGTGGFGRKGGGGCFLREIPPMLLMGLVLGGGYLVCFARFCDTFRYILARVKRRGLAWRPRRFFGYLHSCCLPSGGLILLCAF